MQCPVCKSDTDVRPRRGDLYDKTAAVIKWYECGKCNQKFTTLETYFSEGEAKTVVSILREIDRQYGLLNEVMLGMARRG